VSPRIASGGWTTRTGSANSNRWGRTPTSGAAASPPQCAHSPYAGLSEEGAACAVVYARGDAAYVAPKLLYESLGFRAHARTIPFVRP